MSPEQEGLILILTNMLESYPNGAMAEFLGNRGSVENFAKLTERRASRQEFLSEATPIEVYDELRRKLNGKKVGNTG